MKNLLKMPPNPQIDVKLQKNILNNKIPNDVI